MGLRSHNWVWSEPSSSLCLSSGGDQTRTGHILGEAAQRSDAAERQMTCAQTCILRLLTHLAMLLGSIKDQRVRRLQVTPVVQMIPGRDLMAV